jgi:tetratricopeptide (TPR) repeat protein
MSRGGQGGELDALLEGAQVAWGAGETASAESQLRRAVELAPRHPGALAGLAALRRSLGDFDEAVQLYEAAARALPGEARLMLELAATHLFAGRLEEALRACRRAVQRRPDLPEGHLLLSECHHQSRDAPRARESAQRALRLRPAWGEALVALGNAEAVAGNHTEAEKHFRAALQSGAARAGVMASLGHALRGQGRHEEALEVYREAVAADAANPELRLNVGSTLYELQFLGEALSELEEVVRLAPGSAPAHHALANVLRDLNRLDDAETHYRRALGLVPQFRDAKLHLAGTLHLAGRVEESLALVRELVARDPGFSEARQELVLLLHEQRRIEEMETECRQGAELEPSLPFYAHKLGVALWWGGRHEEALEAWRQAARLAGDTDSQAFCDAKMNAANGLLALGRYREGWEAYRWRSTRRAARERFPSLIEDPRGFLERPPGQRVLICSEQGIGDELFFLRFATRLRERGHRLWLATDRKLVPILGRQTDQFEHVTEREKARLEEADAVLLSADLPLASGQDFAPAFPLRVDETRRERILERLRAFGPPPYVGVTWRAGALPDDVKPLQGLYLVKQMPIEQFAATLRPLAASIVVLQRRPAREEIDRFRTALGRDALDLSDVNDDLADAIAVLAALDEYVGVSNTNMHLLAGLTGKAARVLVHMPPEWRWGLTGPQSPWFPGFRVYRQGPGRGWEAAFGALSNDLTAASPGKQKNPK